MTFGRDLTGVDERKLEGLLRRALQQDLSAGTEAFRDALLARCLDELNGDGADVARLGDGDLAPLATADDLASKDAAPIADKL